MTTWPHDDPEMDYEPDEVPEGKPRGRLAAFAFVAAMAMIGVGSAFAWIACGGSTYTAFALVGSLGGYHGGSPGGSAGTEPKTAGTDEFRVFQQQVVGQMQSNAQALAAQQAEVKRLSDQMAAVSAKIDAIQSSMLAARAAIPAAELRASSAPAKPAKPKPSARISTGGAPLPPPTQLAH